MQTTKDWSGPFRLHRIACFAVVLLCFAELYSQIYFVHWSGKKFESVRVNIWSPYGLVRNNPRLTSPGYSINSQGMRGNLEYSRVKPPKTLRVMILGASVMYSGLGGWFPPDTLRVKADETISEYLMHLLQQDPAMAGINVEVINAAVNFNRLNEIACGYLDEYQFWEPDIVVIGASANTFPIEPPTKVALLERKYNIQGWHPWRFEFERQANDHRVLPLFERAYSTLEESSAFAALVRKVATKANDAASNLSQRLGARYRGLFDAPNSTTPSGSSSDANSISTQEEYDTYIQDALGFVKAIQACAESKSQYAVFFWEYYLVQLRGIKPFTTREERLYEGNLQVRPLIADPTYNFRARDRLCSEIVGSGGVFVDPLEKLMYCDESVFIDYIHYTPAGNKFMAGVIYDAIRKRTTEIAKSFVKD